MRRQSLVTIIGAFVITIVVLATYHPALGLGFFLDDWMWLNWGGRLSLAQYLLRSFSTDVYRPMQAIQWKIAYTLLGSNATGYHFLNVLIHLAVCLLLYRVIGRLTRKWTIAIVSALTFSCLVVIGFPISTRTDPVMAFLETHYGVAVLWPAVADALNTVFYLLTIDFWLTYLKRHTLKHYPLAIGTSILGILTKETSLTLLAVLLLLDLWFVRRTKSLTDLIWCYTPFALTILIYLPFRFVVHEQSPYTQGQYELGNSIVSNLLLYLRTLTLPWQLSEPVSWVWLLVASCVCLYACLVRQNRSVTFLTIGAVLTTLPNVPFYFVLPRFLYLPFIFSMIGYGWLTYRVKQITQARILIPAATTLVIFSNCLVITGEAINFSQVSHENVALLAPILEKHPNFPDDTLLYVIDPPIYSLELQGFFLSQYGRSVQIGSSDLGVRAGLRDHYPSYIFYFDDQSQVHEQRVDTLEITTVNLSLPATFDTPIRLEGYEIANSTVIRGNELVLLLYWKATGKIDQNYTIFAHLVDSTGNIIEGYDAEPQRGRFPTSTLKPEQLIVSTAIISIPSNTPEGENYYLEIGLYHQPTMRRLMIEDTPGHAIADKIVIHPIKIVR